MDIAYISALSALAGSVVGGLTSGITTWLGLRAQMRAGQLAHNKSQREDLYRDFIVAAIASVWQCHREQRATDSGARRRLRHDQQDAHPVLANNCRVR